MCVAACKRALAGRLGARARPCAYSVRCVSAPRAPASASFPLVLPLGSGGFGCGLPARVTRRRHARARRPGSLAGAPHAFCPPPPTGAAHSHIMKLHEQVAFSDSVADETTGGSLLFSSSRPRRESTARRRRFRPCHARRPAIHRGRTASPSFAFLPNPMRRVNM